MDGLSPMMQQYFNIKEQHKDHIMFFRLGDFYEMFFEDAITASKELELTLTGRDCGLAERAPMCGVPHHSAEGYIARLIKKGYKVAICEQTEDPAACKGVVRREVVRVVTPGTLLENNMLEEDANNFLCCIYCEKDGYGVVFADISTGEINLMELDPEDEALTNELARYQPREVIFNPNFTDKTAIAKFMREKLCCTADLLDEYVFGQEEASNKITEFFGSKSAEDMKDRPHCLRAVGALLYYLGETQKSGLERLVTVNVLEETRFMNLDMSTRTNLELIKTLNNGEKRGSLLWVLDRTKTPMGKRLIKTYINQPLVHPAEIDRRMNAVEELYRDELLCANLAEELSGIFDVERLTTRIVYGNAGPREYQSLGSTISKFPALKYLVKDARCDYLKRIKAEIDELSDIQSLIATSITDEPPVSIKDGGVIRSGYSPELDELRELMGNAKEYLGRLEAEEKEKTGIKNLKIGFNKVFGYYLEVTKSYQHLVPEGYIRKQTLANCERYIIQELKELEERIISAQDKSTTLEAQLFEEIRQKIIDQLHRIQQTASAISRLDVFCSLARVALSNRYVRPTINTGDIINIQDGRHPVVEQLLDNNPFVPNDTLLDTRDNQISVITGPNMAGKSTYMRQTALIVLMAQIGSFVPAKSAVIGVVDGIFTRIGASDDMTTGQSTFMVEMREVAHILNNATGKSLLILDEVGRGTSTYDGMSIARAVIEYIADEKKLGAKTLFATHYHELTEMEATLPHVKNYNIAAKKRGDDIIFLRKIVRGGADDSYGIEVSRLAGIPDWIIERARKVLQDMENANPVRDYKRSKRKKNPADEPDEMQISLTAPRSQVEEMLDQIDINTISPIEALTLLYQLKENAK